MLAPVSVLGQDAIDGVTSGNTVPAPVRKATEPAAPPQRHRLGIRPERAVRTTPGCTPGQALRLTRCRLTRCLAPLSVNWQVSERGVWHHAVPCGGLCQLVRDGAGAAPGAQEGPETGH